MRTAVSEPPNNVPNKPACPYTSQLRQLFNSSVDTIICSINRENKFVYVSEACHALLGYAPEEMIGECVSSFLHVEDLRKTAVAGEALIRGKHTLNFENRYYKKDGSLLTISWSCKWDAKEELFFCAGRDVSERKAKQALQKQFEEKIKTQNRQMNEMLERITDAFFAVDEEWRIIYVNSRCEQALGVSKEDYLSRNLWESFPELVGTIYYEQYTRAMHKKVPVHFDAYLPLFDNWFAVNIYPSSTGLSVFFRSISDQKRSEEALRLSNERFRLAAKTDALYDWDIATNHLYWGEGLHSLFGYQSEEFQMSQWEAALHPKECDALMEDLLQTLSDEEAHFLAKGTFVVPTIL